MSKPELDLYVGIQVAEDEPRLDVQHEAVKTSLYGKLHAAHTQYEEILAKNPQASILDVATGTGIWAVEFAELYPEASVKALDINPIKLSASHPTNVKFYIQNAVKPLPTKEFPPQSFDIIHARFIIVHVKQEWPTLLKSIHSLLKPGGLLLLTDANTVSWEKGGPGLKSMAAMVKQSGHDDEAGRHLVAKLLEVGGFESIDEKEIESPIGTWGETEHEKKVGALFEKNLFGVLAVGDSVRKAIGDEGVLAAWAEQKAEVVAELEAGKERPTWSTTCISARKSE